ncbi:MAG: tetratricopeptide (TPR) repeat protein [Myxococcota bacterium]|jgi:tetratricopeptide (TPR) repeat protein
MLSSRSMVAPLLLVATLVFSGCQTSSPTNARRVPGVDPADTELTNELLELDTQIHTLERWLAQYPARVDSDEERRLVTGRWYSIAERSGVLLNVDLDNAELFARVGDIYRQGHNLDVPGAAGQASNAFNRCLALANEHVTCRYNLARLYLALPPRFAPRAEELLVEARELVSPEVRPEFEAALAGAFLAQGRRSAALRQIDLYLTLRPDDLDAQRFRHELMIESQDFRRDR